ncbi:MAG TPA: porin [Moraxellaceae bacterium]|nr:porin [Moraxellaceae bacterium]
MRFDPVVSSLIIIAALPTAVRATDDAAYADLERRLNQLEQQVAARDNTLVISGSPPPSLTFHALVQLDGRFGLDSSPASGSSNTFALRRVEPSVQGALTPFFSFVLMPEFGGTATSSVTADVYGEFLLAPNGPRLRVGKFKEPFSMENLQSAANIAFVERGFPTALSPNRDQGVMVQGQVSRLTWQAGLFNGAPDGADAPPTDGDAYKELALRVLGVVWGQPGAKGDGSLSVGLAATNGRKLGAGGTLPQYRSPGQDVVFQYIPTVMADGDHLRYSPQFAFYRGPFSMLGEFAESRQEVRRTGVPSATAVSNRAAELTLGYVITGERVGYSGVQPRTPYSPGAGWGGVEVVARAGELIIDDKAFSQHLADPAQSVRAAHSTGVGLNWYLTSTLRLMLDYELTRFEGGAASGNRPDEHAVLLRSQVAF